MHAAAALGLAPVSAPSRAKHFLQSDSKQQESPVFAYF